MTTAGWQLPLVYQVYQTKPWALPTPSRTFSPAPVLPGALPQTPTLAVVGSSRNIKRCPGYAGYCTYPCCQGTFRYPSPLRGEHMLTFPLDSSPICSKTEEMSVFEGLFLETFFSDNILIMSLTIWKKGDEQHEVNEPH